MRVAMKGTNMNTCWFYVGSIKTTGTWWRWSLGLINRFILYCIDIYDNGVVWKLLIFVSDMNTTLWRKLHVTKKNLTKLIFCLWIGQ